VDKRVLNVDCCFWRDDDCGDRDFGFSCGFLFLWDQFFPFGFNLDSLSFSSYSIMPCLERNCENSVSLSAGISIWSANSGMLCHSPSLRMSRKLSMSKVVLD